MEHEVRGDEQSSESSYLLFHLQQAPMRRAVDSAFFVLNIHEYSEIIQNMERIFELTGPNELLKYQKSCFSYLFFMFCPPVVTFLLRCKVWIGWLSSGPQDWVDFFLRPEEGLQETPGHGHVTRQARLCLLRKAPKAS